MAPDNLDSSSPTNAASVPVWFWVVSGLALAWNLMGLMAFVAELMRSPEALAAFPAEQQELFGNLPGWYWAVFGLAVVGGTLGCLALLVRKKFAFVLFLASLLGVVLQQVYMYLLSDTLAVLGLGAVVLPTLVLLIALALVWFSKKSIDRGWLR